MPIYTCITYQATCDGCDKEFGVFKSVDEAQREVKKKYKMINGRVYCDECLKKLNESK